MTESHPQLISYAMLKCVLRQVHLVHLHIGVDYYEGGNYLIREVENALLKNVVQFFKIPFMEITPYVL
jgi:hypothetical protein